MNIISLSYNIYDVSEENLSLSYTVLTEYKCGNVSMVKDYHLLELLTPWDHSR